MRTSHIITAAKEIMITHVVKEGRLRQKRKQQLLIHQNKPAKHFNRFCMGKHVIIMRMRHHILLIISHKLLTLLIMVELVFQTKSSSWQHTYHIILIFDFYRIHGELLLHHWQNISFQWSACTVAFSRNLVLFKVSFFHGNISIYYQGGENFW